MIPASSTPDHRNNPKYRHLNLTQGEVVVREIRRHPIGVLQIYLGALFIIVAILVGTGLLLSFGAQGATNAAFGTLPTTPIMALAGLLIVLVVLFAMVGIIIYNGNRLYLTNESVIQNIQTGLFSTKSQHITLGNIEDISFEQDGILPHLFNFGTLRPSTEGEETIYYFPYTSNPRVEAGHIVQAHEEYLSVNPGEDINRRPHR